LLQCSVVVAVCCCSVLLLSLWRVVLANTEVDLDGDCCSVVVAVSLLQCRR